MKFARLTSFFAALACAAWTCRVESWAAEAKLQSLRFSNGRGFYTTPVDVAISGGIEGATIRFTTNGSTPSLTNGTAYSSPLSIGGTTTLRAAAFRNGAAASIIDTHTYIFLEDVIHQSPMGRPPPGWPSSWGGNATDYGMDQRIVASPSYAPTIKEDLQTLPSFSIVTDLNNLFHPTKGIYANAWNHGETWERPVSVELIYPIGTNGFQINCGLRIRGGFSRAPDNPKHALALFFRSSYGTGKLKYPLFGKSGVAEFDRVDLRTFQDYSWSFQGDPRGVFLRDQFSRDTQLAMGQPAERGDFYHLYINGQYWGIYNTCEHPGASYGATYFGGKKEDYDVIKVVAERHSLAATDGNMTAWTRLYNICKAGITNNDVYFRVQGKGPDGIRNPKYECLVDMTNLVDYMLLIVYSGNYDAPTSRVFGNANPNNWFGLRNRNGTDGFKFFAHDSEQTLDAINEDRLGPWPGGDNSVLKSSPQWVWQRFWGNEEFRVFVADRVQRYFFNDGLLTPGASHRRFMVRKEQLDRAVVGESARWGDAKRPEPLTRQNWLRMVNVITNGYFPKRTEIVLRQIKARGLYPSIEAPSYSQNGGFVTNGFKVSISAPAGEIRYTTDGSDPRLIGGQPSKSAQPYKTPVTINQNAVIKSRVLLGNSWSALNEASFTLHPKPKTP